MEIELKDLDMAQLNYFQLGTLFSECGMNYPLLWCHWVPLEQVTVYCNWDRMEELKGQFGEMDFMYFESIEVYYTSAEPGSALAEYCAEQFSGYQVKEGL